MSDEFKPYPEWKMHVYSNARQENNACIYYRQHVPLKAFQDLGLAVAFFDRGKHHYDPKVRDEQALTAMLTYDINLLYGMGGDQGSSIVNPIKSMRPGLVRGKLLYPPSVVYDIDDNLDWVHPFNPTFAFFGVRAGDGHVLKPGENVLTRLADGREVLLWQDGVTRGEKEWVYNAARNIEYNKSLHKFAASCDGFTSPSRYLINYMREHHKYPEGYVYPNSIIPEDWKPVKFAPRKKEIRVLWQGGGSHMSDWFALRAPLKYILKKYPHVKLVLFGSVFGWIADAIPEKQLEVHEWVPYDGYRATRSILDCDINLCVLRDDEFSRSKSAIKWYEGSILHKPEATLAPNMPPYNDEIVDGETGMLYDTGPTPEAAAESFAANLEALIVNADLRQRVAANAKKWVLENRHYHKTAPGHYEYLLDLRKRKAKETPFDPEKDAETQAKMEKVMAASKRKPKKKSPVRKKK